MARFQLTIETDSQEDIAIISAFVDYWMSERSHALGYTRMIGVYCEMLHTLEQMKPQAAPLLDRADADMTWHDVIEMTQEAAKSLRQVQAFYDYWKPMADAGKNEEAFQADESEWRLPPPGFDEMKAAFYAAYYLGNSAEAKAEDADDEWTRWLASREPQVHVSPTATYVCRQEKT